MPDATITSTASTFGTITGTFAADQSTVTGTVTSLITGTLSGSVGVPGPQGPAGPQGPEGPPGPPGPGSTWGTITGTLSAQTDLQTALNLKANLASPVFTGDPQAPTATFGDNDTTIATTAFVQAGLLGGTANARNLEVYVRNQSGSTIPAGAIVYISGATGNRPLITLAQANNDANSAQTIGFVKTSIANNGFGYVIVRGELENIDTSALTEGVQLYLSPTTAGTWTTTKPSAPEHLVYVGIVIRSHPTLGVILVAVQNGYELNELHDVAISSPTNGQVLKYDSATNLWKNSTDSAGVAWGGITGTLSNQTDLQSALDAKQSVSGMTAYLTKAGNLSGLTNLATARDNLQLGTSNDVYFSSVISNTGTVTSILGGATNGLEIFDGVTNGIKIDKDGITFPDLTVQTTAFTTAQLGAYLAKASNLSDLASASTARTNLGLGSLAVVNDAPSDGNQYARKNGAWDIVSSTSPYITSVSSPLSVTGGNLTIDLSAYLTTSAAASTYQTLAGMSSYLTTSAAASTYYPLTGNPSGFITSSALTGYATESWVTSQGYLTSAALTGYATESWVTAGFYPLTGNPSGFITSAALSPYLLSSTAASTYYLQSNPDGYITSAALSGYAPLASPGLTGNVTITSNTTGAALFIEQSGTGNILTLHDQASDTTFVAIDQNGKVGTIASTTTNAGFNVPHGTAPTTPVNGDIWTTTSGLLARINGVTRQYVDLDGTQTINGSKTFSGANQTLGNSTTAGTINIGTGAVASGSKAINIGTGTVAPATCTMVFGTAGVAGNITFNGNGTFNVANNNVQIHSNTATSTVSIGVGATVAAATKTINIGTEGLASSTTNINLGTVAGGAATVTTNALLLTRASATTGSGLRIPHGTAPTTPTNGDVWTDTAGFYARINGATVTLSPPVGASLPEARQFTNDTKFMSPRDTLWSMLSQDFIDISGPDMTTTNTGTITSVQIGQLSRNIRPGTAGACSCRIRTFGTSQVDQTWTSTSRPQPKSFLNFSLRSIHSGRSTIDVITDANFTAAFYYGKAEADGVGDLVRRGYGWKMVGGAGSRFLQLQAHNGTTLSSVTSSFAVTAGVAFDWDIESDGAGNVTLYVNGSSVATTTGGPTGSVNLTAVVWQEEMQAAAALASPFTDFTNSRGRFIVINTW